MQGNHYVVILCNLITLFHQMDNIQILTSGSLIQFVLCRFRDADDAVYARDGYDYDGYKLRVEFPRGGGGSFRGSRDRGGYRGDRRPGPPARRSQYRVLVTGKSISLLQ